MMNHPTTRPENYRTAQEELNAARGGDYWSPSDYSSEPDYGEVDESVFDFLNRDVEELLEEE